MNWGFSVAGAIALSVVLAWSVTALCNVRDAAKLRRAVFENLDAARDGRQFDAYGYLHGLSAEDIAYDMVLYCEDVRPHDKDEILPYVMEWLQKNGVAS